MCTRWPERDGRAIRWIIMLSVNFLTGNVWSFPLLTENDICSLKDFFFKENADRKISLSLQRSVIIMDKSHFMTPIISCNFGGSNDTESPRWDLWHLTFNHFKSNGRDDFSAIGWTRPIHHIPDHVVRFGPSSPPVLFC